MESDPNVQQMLQNQESAHTEDKASAEANTKLDEIVLQMTTTSIGVRDLAEKFRTSPREQASVVQDLEETNPADPPPSQTILLQQSILLAKHPAGLFPPEYKWFPDTFKVDRDQAKMTLATVIRSVIGELYDDGFLEEDTFGELRHEAGESNQVDVLIRNLEARSNDFTFICAFQGIMLTIDSMKPLLSDRLQLAGVQSTPTAQTTFSHEESLLPEEYKWFPKTFKVKRTVALNSLANVAGSVFGRLNDQHLVGNEEFGPFLFQRNKYKQAEMIFDTLDRHSINARLIRTFQDIMTLI
ncbi:hypothetical protein MSAN_01762300 [Mycena sanguinolenta]|uniref:Uncharacterized protein n=1 Tax=Mycena sanguinolenta TaxID=230812 RepID=A0A8H6XXF8_9AGAR|nr:hypothetical protein MSAN_01762300 [Mycena sanguinolenta]